MAPVRRRSKKGDRRMDAALDAMRQYGFDDKVVCRTVKELLRVYDGEWSFMEEYAYKLLIDTIIDKQEAEAQTRSESTNGAATSATRELVASDLPDPLNSMPLIDMGKSPQKAVQTGIGPSEANNRGSSSQIRLENPKDKSASHVQLPRYPRQNRRSKYAERVRKILGVRRSSNSSKDPPCKRRYCYGYLSDGEQDDPIDVEPRSAASSGIPVELLRSRSKHKQSNNPGSIHHPGSSHIPHIKW